VWAWYLGALFVTWLGAAAVLDDAGFAWTYVHLIHGILSYYMLHYTKGSVYGEDQGDFNRLTVWEELDNQVYGTRTRKFLTLVPIVLFVAATHGTDFRKQPLGLNLGCVLLLLIAKLPAMHKVRIFGINAW
jgi:hypothetical protein